MTEFKNYLRYQRQLSETTIKNYSVFLRHFQEFLLQNESLFARKKLNKIIRQDISDFLEYLRSKVSVSSVSQYVVALRCYYTWAYYILKSRNLEEVNFFLGNIVRTKKRQAAVAVPTREEVDRLRKVFEQYLQLNSWDKSKSYYKTTLRAYLVIELFASSGIRANELAYVERRDIDLEERTVFIRKGKGGHQRVSIFGEKAVMLLKEYFELYGFAPDKRIFPAYGNFFWRIVKTWAAKAQINPKIHPHSFRHYFITESEKQGVALQVAADQVGHEDINTTRKHYRHLGIEYVKSAYDGKII